MLPDLVTDVDGQGLEAGNLAPELVFPLLIALLDRLVTAEPSRIPAIVGSVIAAIHLDKVFDGMQILKSTSDFDDVLKVGDGLASAKQSQDLFGRPLPLFFSNS